MGLLSHVQTILPNEISISFPRSCKGRGYTPRRRKIYLRILVTIAEHFLARKDWLLAVFTHRKLPFVTPEVKNLYEGDFKPNNHWKEVIFNWTWHWLTEWRRSACRQCLGLESVIDVAFHHFNAFDQCLYTNNSFYCSDLPRNGDRQYEFSSLYLFCGLVMLLAKVFSVLEQESVINVAFHHFNAFD